MSIFLAILAGKDPRHPLTLSRKWAIGCVVVRAFAVKAVSRWPGRVTLNAGSLIYAGLHYPGSCGCPSEGGGGPSSSIRGLNVVNRIEILSLYSLLRIRVVDLLLRLYVLNPLLRWSVAFRREVSGFTIRWPGWWEPFFWVSDFPPG